VLPAPASERDPISFDDIVPLSSGGAAILDGGFAQSSKPASVFPGSMSNELATDGEPVSLRDLQVVLAPIAPPPAWSGANEMAEDVTLKVPAPPVPEPKQEEPRAAAPAEKPAARPPKPSFFRVSVPPPAAPAEEEIAVDEEPAPSSDMEDLLSLTAAPEANAKRKDLDIFGLSGGLFANQPPPKSVPPIDLLEPVAKPPQAAETPVLAKGAAIDLAPRSTPPIVEPRAPRSSAPGPLISERFPAPSNRGRTTGLVIGAVAASALGIALLVHAGGDTPAEQKASAKVELEAKPPVQEAAPEAPRPQTLPAATHEAPAPAATTAEPKSKPAVVRAVEQTRPVERAPAAPLPERPAAPPPVEKPAPPPPAAAGGDFDRGAAKAALAAAAGAAASCKQADDPSGGARVSVTFAPSGRVSSAVLTGGAFQGTKTGACIAGAFRGATVPPFAGDPVTVSKEVSIR
jgi:hypothetical protein